MMVKDTWREYNAILWAVEVQSIKILKVWIYTTENLYEVFSIHMLAVNLRVIHNPIS